jgi:hypothetical protein
LLFSPGLSLGLLPFAGGFATILLGLPPSLVEILLAFAESFPAVFLPFFGVLPITAIPAPSIRAGIVPVIGRAALDDDVSLDPRIPTAVVCARRKSHKTQETNWEKEGLDSPLLVVLDGPALRAVSYCCNMLAGKPRVHSRCHSRALVKRT